MGIVVLSLLVGCFWVSSDDIDERTGIDADGDGILVDDDCDDSDPQVGAETTWFADADNDDWGNTTAAHTQCEHQPWFVPQKGDCDDSDATIHPEATEIWYDGTDSDCDGWDDFDADKDGERSQEHGGMDCNDEQALVNSASEEICGDGLDNNCDGEGGDCGWYGEEYLGEEPVILGEVDGGRLGLEILALGDINGDDTDDFAVAEYRGWTGVQTFAGLVGLVLDPVEGKEGLSTAASTRYLGVNDDDRTGVSMAFVKDVDGSGLDVLAIGAERYPEGGELAGAVHLVSLDLRGDVKLSDDAVTIFGLTEERLGRSVVGPGDVNGDGVVDLWSGGWGWGEMENQGAAWLVHGPITASGKMEDLASWRLTGLAPYDSLGWRVAAGDLNGDGVAELVASAPGAEVDDGSVYVVDGMNQGDLSADEALVILGGSNETLGQAIELVDLDGDGHIDMLLGAPGAGDTGPTTGVVAVIAGPVTESMALADALFRVSGDKEGERLGSSISSGDVNADGVQDLLVGSEGWEDNQGRAFLVLGPLSGAEVLSDRHPWFPGLGDQDRVGGGVEVLGDLDGDGYLELGLGAWGTTEESGAAYVLAGGPGI